MVIQNQQECRSCVQLAVEDWGAGRARWQAICEIVEMQGNIRA